VIGATRLAERYEPLEVVGQGGEATVLKAIDTRHDRLVALKVRVVPAGGSLDDLLAETRALLSLPPHEGLVHARDDFFDDGRHVLVLDWVDGVNLARLLTEQGRPGLPVSSVLHWIAQTADALTVLHHHGVVHGDVKPANLIVDRTGRIVLVDLGSSSAPRTATLRGGTSGFRAPEVAAGGSAVRASDVFSLSATAFALLTGTAPTGEAPAWVGMSDDVAARLESALRAGLAIDPARRPPTPGALAERLRAGWDDQTPAGVGTVLLTDVTESTRLWELSPERLPALLADLQLLVDRCVEAHGGRRLGATVEGDATMSVFTNALHAVRAAVALQRDLTARPAALRVRAGLATGELVPVDHEVLGPTVNRAARIRDLARAGEILLSASTADVVRLALPADVQLASLGPHALRGLDGTDDIAAIVTEGVSSPPDPSRSPYPGLASFGRDDADLFFGREETVERCLELLATERFVAVVGASGSGKSSLVLAGISPRLAEVVAVRPGVHPGQALLNAGIPGHDDAVLVVDQLEELVTLCHDPAEQEYFVDTLVAHRGGLVVAVRADLYGEFGAFSDLADRLASSQVLLGPLTDADLRRAVQEPALRCGLEVEDGLAEVIATELGEAPGALPLMGHALREAWMRRDGRTITVAGYRASGGVRSAIATTAEQALATLDDEGRAVARRLLLRMVELRPTGDDTRRWASRREITDIDPLRADDVTAALTDSRLLVVDHDQITVAHEALLRAWPRLNGWIVEERADLLAHQELREASERWEAGGRNESDLYRGLRLHTALDLTRRDGLAGQERDFIDASQLLRDREHTEARRRTRRLRILAAITSVFAAIAVAVGIIAVAQRDNARQARTEADVAAREAEDALLTARARDLADDELDLALLLAVEAQRRSGDADALDALAHVLRAQPAIERFTPLGATAGLDVGADGRRGAILDGERVTRFALPDLSMESPVTVSGATGLAMSPTSSQIAVTTHEGVTVLDAATGAIDAVLPVPPSVDGRGPDGVTWIGRSTVGVRHSDQVSVVDIDTGYDPDAVSTPVNASAAVAADDSGRRLAIGPRPPRSLYNDTEPKVRIVDATTGELFRVVALPSGQVTDLSFQPGGDLLAVGTADAGMYVVDVESGEIVLRRVTPLGESGQFSPDGTKLAIRDDAGAVTVVEPATGTVLLPPVIQARKVRNVYFTPDADAVVADAVSALVTIRLDGREPLASAPFGEPGDMAGAVRSDGAVAWAIRPPVDQLPVGPENDYQSVAYDPETGRSLHTIPGVSMFYGSDDDWIYAWWSGGRDLVIDPGSGSVLFPGDTLPVPRFIGPDLRTSMIVRTTVDGRYVDVRRLPDLSPIESGLGPFPWQVLALTISTDGRRVALATVEPTRAVMIHILDISSGIESVEPIQWRNEDVRPTSIAFTADDRTLIIGDQAGGIVGLDVATGTVSASRFGRMRGPVVIVAPLGDGRLVAVSHAGLLSMFAATGERIGPPIAWTPRDTPDIATYLTSDIALNHLLAPDPQGLRLWNTDMSTWPVVACQRAGRNLTPDEWRRYMPSDEPHRSTCPQFPAG
jgi:class 3 adenylate cyclase/tRNA A-37 threonylcarbamoyl transferase component Bud32/WD40 repeat protein